MTEDQRRTSDLVELHALCSRYMSYEPVCRTAGSRCSRPTRVQRVRHAPTRSSASRRCSSRTPRAVHRQHARRRARRRPATGKQHFVFIDQQTHAMRLGWYRDEYVRTADGWRIRRAIDHVHAQARRLRFRHASTIRSPDGAKESTAMSDLPKIISVDDHVVEPPQLWQDRLPSRFARAGARASSGRAGATSRSMSGATYKQEMTDDGTWGDYWMYEDRLIYVHKRHVAIPLDATPDGDVQPIRPVQDVHRRDHLRRDAARLLRAEGARRGPRARRRRRLARVPDVSPLLRADVHGGQGPRARAWRACRAYNDWMIDEWCGDSDGHLIPLCLIPLWDVELAAAEVARNAARGRAGHLLQRDPDPPGPAEHPHRLLGSAVRRRARRRARPLCMHIGSSSKMPAASPDAPPSTDIMLSFNNSMASLADFLFSGVLVRFPELKLAYSEGQIGWIPYALERADNVWEFHSSWTHAEGDDPRAAVDLLPRPHLRLLHQRRPRLRVDRRGRRGQHLLRDRLPAHRHDVAVRAGGGRADDRRVDR